MDVYSLQELQERYLLRHESRQSSPSTIARYKMTFLLFDRFLTDTGLAADSRSLTSASMMAFSVWLRSAGATEARFDATIDRRRARASAGPASLAQVPGGGTIA